MVPFSLPEARAFFHVQVNLKRASEGFSWVAGSNVFLKLKYSLLLQLDGRMEHIGPGRG